MKYNPPLHVVLTDEESKWYQELSSANDENMEWKPIRDAMESLYKSLMTRKAIPEMRLRIFADSKYAEIYGKSPKQMLEANGIPGEFFYRNPGFRDDLRYFINGPDLPENVIHGFCRILEDDRGTHGMVFNQLRRYVRSCVREYHLDRHSAASEFYKLAIEVKKDVSTARSIRQAALSTY